MDVEYPYAEGHSRLQLLYRLPTAPLPRRLLVVGEGEAVRLIGAGWGGPFTALAGAALADAAAQGGARFDAVAMPVILGDPGAASGCPPAATLLHSAHRLLAPDGVIVGHVDHLRTLRRLVTPAGLAAALRPRSFGSASGCQAALLRAGFTAPECFHVQPNIQSPMGLIPCERAASRAHFLRSIRAAQGHYSRPAYTARLVVAWLGLGGMQQPQLFFWARKPC